MDVQITVSCALDRQTDRQTTSEDTPTSGARLRINGAIPLLLYIPSWRGEGKTFGGS
jgi:hypothetical protein